MDTGRSDALARIRDGGDVLAGGVGGVCERDPPSPPAFPSKPPSP